ncbi:hypothetical protein [Rhizobium sp. G21]|uniref:hypothetical protein n=1 Tax=Rhizobium sp. G21 TaxID=2758439 RepID=UPI001603D641|nr:hypothetical protein [Rhizobium sp. G21]MBB1250495.1 hypothetical protein [Rhizobium sp. G21]
MSLTASPSAASRPILESQIGGPELHLGGGRAIAGGDAVQFGTERDRVQPTRHVMGGQAVAEIAGGLHRRAAGEDRALPGFGQTIFRGAVQIGVEIAEVHGLEIEHRRQV